jgi:hypothetical protein
MENQHRQIKGYRELNETEIAQMNRIKELGPLIEEVVADLRSNAAAVDQRWVAIGVTNLQQGLMALTRAVATPDFF